MPNAVQIDQNGVVLSAAQFPRQFERAGVIWRADAGPHLLGKVYDFESQTFSDPVPEPEPVIYTKTAFLKAVGFEVLEQVESASAAAVRVVDKAFAAAPEIDPLDPLTQQCFDVLEASDEVPGFDAAKRLQLETGA